MKRYAQLTIRSRVGQARLLISEGTFRLVVLNGELLLSEGTSGHEARESERGRQSILHQCGGEMPAGLSRDSALAIKAACGHGRRKVRRVKRRRW